MGLFSDYKHLIKEAGRNRLVRHVLILNVVIKLSIVATITTLIGMVILLIFQIPITINILYYCSAGAVVVCLIQLPADVANDVCLLEKKKADEAESL